METFNNVVLSIKDFLWGPIMLCLLIGTHVLLTIRTKGIQRKTFTGVKLSVTPDKEASGDIGGFAALATALAATIGTGNIVGCIVICIINGAHIPAAFAAIVKGAFNPAAAGGGFVGATVVACIRAGVSRGLFTNESGLGSAPIVDACAATRNPARQALISMSGVFWDTIVVCLLTGLVLVSSIIKDPVGMEGLVGANMTAGAFNAIPVVGPAVLTFGLLTFAWSTILGWSYYGERCWVYLCGVKSIMPFRVVWTFVVLVGCVAALDVVWNIADVLNACMAFPNCIALIGLSGVIASETKKYVWDKNAEKGGLMKWMDDVAPQLDK